MAFFKELIQKLVKDTDNFSKPHFLFLHGDLGVGKTTFTKELLSHYGYDDSKVQSPSFLKLIEHDVEGLGKVIHIDCYRIEEVNELLHLDLLQYTEAKLIIMEWPKVFLDSLWLDEEFTSYFSNFEKIDVDIKSCKIL